MIDSYVDVFHKKGLRTADLPTLVGELTGHELITTNLNCGGYHDGIKREIAITPNHPYPEECLLHEMAHAAQYELGLIDKQQRIISEELYTEWQADTIAKEMHIRMYPDIPIHPLAFKSYFDQDGWMFLIDWYGSWMQNDIEKFLE